MATSTSKNNSKLFIPIEGRSRDRLPKSRTTGRFRQENTENRRKHGSSTPTGKSSDFFRLFPAGSSEISVIFRWPESSSWVINKDLEYPSFCIFRISTKDPKTNNEILVYERKISIQANALEDGLQLHLSTLATATYGYCLSAEATDNNQTKFTSIASIASSPVGMIKANNPCHLNTIILKIKD